MELSKDTWHYKNFRAWQTNSCSSRNRDLRERYSYAAKKIVPPLRQPDLCTYTRIVLIYGPVHRVVNKVNNSSDRTKFLLAISAVYLFLLGVLTIGNTLVDAEEKIATWLLFAIPIIAIAGFMTIAIIIVAAGIGIETLVKKRRDMRTNTTPPDKEPNVVVEFARARKRKICPLIEFKEE